MCKYGSFPLAALFLAALLALAAPAGAAVDDFYTKSLVHLNGANGSTTFTDESGKVWTPQGTAQLRTDRYKFGGASAFCDGSGCYIETPNAADFEPGAAPFTIDFWIYPLDAGSDSYLAGKSFPDYAAGYFIGLHNQSIKIQGFNSWSYPLFSDASATPNAWHHIAVSATADTVYLFVDGILKVSDSRRDIPAASDIPFRIGWTNNFGGTGFNGYLDEFRFSKGIARWTANFTPPPQPYGGNGAVNLAFLHGVASANATYDVLYPSRAIDGNWDTQWATPSTVAWLQVDLQNRYKVYQINLVGPHGVVPGNTIDYNLYISTNGTDWDIVKSGTLVDSLDPTVYVANIPLTPSRAIRYVKYEVVGGSHWASSYELEIWGGPNPVTNAPQNFLLLD